MIYWVPSPRVGGPTPSCAPPSSLPSRLLLLRSFRPLRHAYRWLSPEVPRLTAEDGCESFNRRGFGDVLPPLPCSYRSSAHFPPCCISYKLSEGLRAQPEGVAPQPEGAGVPSVAAVIPGSPLTLSLAVVVCAHVPRSSTASAVLQTFPTLILHPVPLIPITGAAIMPCASGGAPPIMESIAFTIAAIAIGLCLWGVFKSFTDEDIPGVNERHTYGGRYYNAPKNPTATPQESQEDSNHGNK